MKIYYKKTNGKFVGALNIDKSRAGTDEIESKDFKDKVWFDFVSENGTKDIYIIDGELVAKEYEEKLEDVRNTVIGKSKSYLDRTDWYVIRFNETNKEIPGIVRTNRNSARININIAEKDSITLEELKNININYEE